MRIKHIVIICVLLVAAALSGCSQGNGEFSGISSHGEVKPAPTQTAEPTVIMEGSAARAENISFSAGELSPPIKKPEHSHSAEPSATATPAQARGKSAKEEKAAPTPTTTPKPASTPIVAMPSIATPMPTSVPTPAAKPMPTIIPTPTAVPTPAATPAPIVIIAPEPPIGKMICNTCGADITRNIAEHGDGHLLNGENFSYREDWS